MHDLATLLRIDRARRGITSDAAYADVLGVSFHTFRGWMRGKGGDQPLGQALAVLLAEANGLTR